MKKTIVILACSLGVMGTIICVGKSIEFSVAVHDETMERLYNDSILYYLQHQEFEDSMRELLRCPCLGDSIHENNGDIQGHGRSEFMRISNKHWEEGVGWNVDPLDPIK